MNNPYRSIWRKFFAVLKERLSLRFISEKYESFYCACSSTQEGLISEPTFFLFLPETAHVQFYFFKAFNNATPNYI
jgi:hypothetical protein